MKRCAVILSFVFIVLGCKDSSIDPPITEFYFDVILNGKGGIPETISKATGTFKGTYYSNKRVLTYTLTYDSGIIPNGAGFYKGTNQAAGTLAINTAPTAFITPYQGITAELSTAQITELLTGQWYIAVRSALYSSGEIRAQLVPTHN